MFKSKQGSKVCKLFRCMCGIFKGQTRSSQKNELQSKQSLVNNVSVNFDFNYNSQILSEKKLFSD